LISFPLPPVPLLPQRIHFLKEDEKLLRKLLSKIKAQADTVRKRAIVKGGRLCFVWSKPTPLSPLCLLPQVDVHEAAGAQASELSSLKAIVGKYNVAQADLDKLLDWKHAH
jgi:hypothetical protein